MTKFWCYTLICFFSLPIISYATFSVAVSENNLELGVSCDDAGDNNQTEAIYASTASNDTGLYFSDPNTGINPNITTCPTTFLHLYDSNLWDTYTARFDIPQWIMINPAGGIGNTFYGTFYIKDCEGTTLALLENECPTEELPAEVASTTDELRALGTISFGLGIIIVLMFLGFTGYIFNKISSKKPWK